MRLLRLTGMLIFSLSVCQVALGAANLYFVKMYSEDFKKNATTNFFGGESIYGVLNVTAIAVNDNNLTSLDEFADAEGGVTIRIYFPTLDKEVYWRIKLTSGKIKNNRFLFTVMPEKAELIDNDFMEVLKVFNEQKGKVLKVTVRVGQKGTTVWWEDDLTVDLTKGLGIWEGWYTKSAPTSFTSKSTFYNVCSHGSNMLADLNAREITVQTFTNDSIKFSVERSTFFAKKIPGYNYMKGGSGDFGQYYVIKVDETSLAVYQENGKTYSYFNMNRALLNETNERIRCATDAIQKFEAELKLFTANELIEQNKKNKIELSQYVHSLKSRRNDPVLEKKIQTWWNVHNPEFPVTKVYLLDPEFSITRDKYNQVLRKSIGALIVYKGNSGSCMMQWDRFGYEHLGGGAFNDEMGFWSDDMNGNYYIKVSSLFIYANNNFELDCSIVK